MNKNIFWIVLVASAFLASCYTRKTLITENVGGKENLKIFLREGKGSRSIIGTLYEKEKKAFTTVQVLSEFCDTVFLVKQGSEINIGNKKTTTYLTRYIIQFDNSPEIKFSSTELELYNKVWESNRTSFVCNNLPKNPTGYKLLSRKKI